MKLLFLLTLLSLSTGETPSPTAATTTTTAAAQPTSTSMAPDMSPPKSEKEKRTTSEEASPQNIDYTFSDDDQAVRYLPQQYVQQLQATKSQQVSYVPQKAAETTKQSPKTTYTIQYVPAQHISHSVDVLPKLHAQHTPKYQAEQATKYQAEQVTKYQAETSPHYQTIQTPKYQAEQSPKYQIVQTPKYQAEQQSPKYQIVQTPKYQTEQQSPKYQIVQPQKYQEQTPKYQFTQSPKYQYVQPPKYQTAVSPKYQFVSKTQQQSLKSSAPSLNSLTPQTQYVVPTAFHTFPGLATPQYYTPSHQYFSQAPTYLVPVQQQAVAPQHHNSASYSLQPVVMTFTLPGGHYLNSPAGQSALLSFLSGTGTLPAGGIGATGTSSYHASPSAPYVIQRQQLAYLIPPVSHYNLSPQVTQKTETYSHQPAQEPQPQTHQHQQQTASSSGTVAYRLRSPLLPPYHNIKG